MRRLLYLFLTVLTLSASAQRHNPVLPGFHPDPSVCRVGSDYYLVNSSFQYFPGVPVYHSTDLENWHQVGNVLTRRSQLPLDGLSSWQGIYAPTIRHHNGTFYVVTTLVGNGQSPFSGNFLVTATDPAGPWSEPILLAQGGIDPSLYFEGDRCYLVSNPDNTITLCEIDPQTGRQLAPSRAIWQGTGGRWPEGPHLYRKDGYYYLLISEGGTELAHSITMARSRNIYGPYEPHPRNPILTNCNVKGQAKQVQGTGHGDLVQKSDGSWWMTFLAYRHFGGSYHHLGRETFLAPVEWGRDGWPVVNGGNPIDTLAPSRGQHRHYTFDRPLGPEWLYIQNPDSSRYERRHNGMLRLYGSIYDMHENQQPTFVGIRQESASVTVETKLALFDFMDGDEAGLCVYQSNEGYVQCCLHNNRGERKLQLHLQLKGGSYVKAEKVLTGRHSRIWLRMTSDGSKYRFHYSTDGQQYHSLDAIECPLLSTEVVGGFTGVVVGMYARMASTRYPSGYSFADFEYFDYDEN